MAIYQFLWGKFIAVTMVATGLVIMLSAFGAHKGFIVIFTCLSVLTMGRKTDRQTDPQTDDSTCLWGKAWTGAEEDTGIFLLAGDGFSVDLGGHIGSPKEAGGLEAFVLLK